MNLEDIGIEDLIPHRGRMLLIDEIIDVDVNRAVTSAVVSEEWPLFDGKSANPIVLIELVAQTAGVANGWDRIQKRGLDSEKKGWLVGVKKADFFIDAIPLHTRIVTRCENTFKYDSFREIQGSSKIGPDIICEISLQVFQAGQDNE
jgi:predicted hotdog family 3-hydroxylacyl-ACP dehydratase